MKLREAVYIDMYGFHTGTLIVDGIVCDTGLPVHTGDVRKHILLYWHMILIKAVDNMQ